MVAKAAASPILQLIRRVVEDRRTRELPDQELLQRFRAQHDQAAFQALLCRHGAMVLDVCRGVLGNEADAEDAFQATFLILARNASSIRKTASLGSWLHGVAHRTALKALAQSAARRKHEAGARQPQASAPDDLSWREVRQVLHEELSGLPERYRAPLVLCYLEGATQEAAAIQLRLPRSTLRDRLEGGRTLLRTRLVRRGLGPAALLVAAAWPTANASASVPPPVMVSTVKAASLFAAGRATTGVISARVAALTEGVLKTMFLTKLKAVTAVLLTFGLLGVGLGTGSQAYWGQVGARARGAENQALAPASAHPVPVAFVAQQKQAKIDNELLQGVWVIVKTVEDGKEQEGIIGGIKIADNKIVMTSVLGQSTHTFAIDATKKPKWIDLTFAEGKGFFGSTAGEKTQGIYQLEGNTLTLCAVPADKDRPKEFVSKPGSGHRLAVLRRLPPADKRADDLRKNETRSKVDNETLQGTWVIVKAVFPEKRPEGIIGGVEIAGNKFVMTSVLGKAEYTFTIDGTKNPQWIDATGVNDSIHGIFRLDGDSLFLFFVPTDHERPRNFDAETDLGHKLTLQRLRPVQKTDDSRPGAAENRSPVITSAGHEPEVKISLPLPVSEARHEPPVKTSLPIPVAEPRHEPPVKISLPLPVTPARHEPGVQELERQPLKLPTQDQIDKQIKELQHKLERQPFNASTQQDIKRGVILEQGPGVVIKLPELIVGPGIILELKVGPGVRLEPTAEQRPKATDGKIVAVPVKSEATLRKGELLYHFGSEGPVAGRIVPIKSEVQNSVERQRRFLPLLGPAIVSPDDKILQLVGDSIDTKAHFLPLLGSLPSSAEAQKKFLPLLGQAIVSPEEKITLID